MPPCLQEDLWWLVLPYTVLNCVPLCLSMDFGRPWIKFALPAFTELFMLKSSLPLYSLRFAEQSVSFFSLNLTVVLKKLYLHPLCFFSLKNDSLEVQF